MFHCNSRIADASAARSGAVLLLLLAILIPGPVGAQINPLSERIRERVDQMRYAEGSGLPASPWSYPYAVAAFYEKREFQAAWGQPANRAALIAALRSLSQDGLNPDDYQLSVLASPWPDGTDLAALADRDLLATQSYLLALIHLYRGKVDPQTLDPQWNFETPAMDQLVSLQAAIDAVDQQQIGPLFLLARPQHPLYAALRDALLQLREIQARGGWPQIDSGPTLKPGMTDARVQQLRQRLQAVGLAPPAEADPQFYDAALSEAVQRYQSRQYLDDDAAVGKKTLAALNVPVSARIDQLRVNMERARWLLRQIKGDFVLVDIAGYRVHYFVGTTPVWSSRVVVGRPYRRTPSFRSEISYITLNPTWTVPPTILYRDVLPRQRRDPGYLARNHIRVFNAAGVEVAPAAVDWNQPAGLTLRQDPGPDNSLGQVVMRFPNPYSVYLHDTPHKELFGHTQRAFSSGCIRTEHPFDLVALLLSDQPQWSRAAIDQAVAAGRTMTINLTRKLPILILYWTVDLYADGQLGFRQDIYHRDGALLQALQQRE